MLVSILPEADEKNEIFLVHLKSSLERDGAQMCVAHNVMWAALEGRHDVKVLVDADAMNSFRIGCLGNDDIEDFKIPEDLRQALAKQFDVSLDAVPRTCGEYLLMLEKLGVVFYQHGFSDSLENRHARGAHRKVSAKFFKPVTLKEMLELRAWAACYMAY